MLGRELFLSRRVGNLKCLHDKPAGVLQDVVDQGRRGTFP